MTVERGHLRRLQQRRPHQREEQRREQREEEVDDEEVGIQPLRLRRVIWRLRMISAAVSLF
ncbi:MAG: hypothetical protein IPK17_21360 [Chloroflexi bacterium]|uniref:hypothetical protein n=1 Tax=Candidatus Flexifilum breve TaxID=3140694 RepID=UPI003136DD59|nr:hypothetical protein [Chloroflexota bacterium]